MSKDNSESTRDLLRSFPRVFWVANVMELFERGAYYGLHALLARYLTDKVGGGLGFSEDETGLLQSVVYAVTYLVPILGGALADRYGYRRMLLIAFSVLSAGYFISGQVTTYSAIFATLVFMATGAGLFKPLVSGTIARVTDEKTSGLGFGIFYWTINLGALVAPLLAGWLKGFSWSYMFTASSIYCALMLIPAAFFYKEPPKPENTKKLKEVLREALMVLSDARFMLLVFVYSCFWILYFQNFGTVLWYLRDFVDATPVNNAVNALFTAIGLNVTFSFDAQHITVVNALTIVLLQIFISRIFKNKAPLPTMITGMIIGTLGFVCLAASQNAWVLVAGVLIFTIGEVTCHPKYIGYIGMIAPADKKALYLGYSFLYGVIGSLIGANVGGEMYHSILSPMVGNADAGATVRTFWGSFAILGFVAAGGLLVYHKLFGKDTDATRRRARRVMLFVYGLLIVGAAGIVFFVYNAKGFIPPKTWIQGGIMLVVGIGGLSSLLKGGSGESAEAQ